jgi:hypothetical protein
VNRAISDRIPGSTYQCHRAGRFASATVPCCGLLLLLLFATVPEYVQAQAGIGEYRVKAGFLFHFAQLVEWPAAAASGPEFALCVLGDDPFHGELENTLSGKAIGSRPIHILHVKQSQEARACQVLFIGNTEDQHLPRIFKDLGNSAVVTVGEASDFIDRGGMIRFTFEQDKVRFEINLKPADAAGLKFSSRLLLLATNVVGKQG